MEHPLQKPCVNGQLPLTATLWGLETEDLALLYHSPDLALFISLATGEFLLWSMASSTASTVDRVGAEPRKMEHHLD